MKCKFNYLQRMILVAIVSSINLSQMSKVLKNCEIYKKSKKKFYSNLHSIHKKKHNFEEIFCGIFFSIFIFY